MTNSEKLLSAFAEGYFYKEFVYSNLKFKPQTGIGTEVELADLIINLEDVVLAIQLKERNDTDRTYEKAREEKWLNKRCKQAKEQIKQTIMYINSEEITFENARGKSTKINQNAEIVPLVVFENNSIIEYEHLLKSNSGEGINVGCMSLADFREMCINLISPIEIIEYIKWRQAFYVNNGNVDIMIYDMDDGLLFSKPQNKESLIYQYLQERYGDWSKVEKDTCYQSFRNAISVLYEHTYIMSEENGCYEIMKFLSHLFLDEIKYFVERIDKSLIMAQKKKYGVVGTLRNTLSEYAIVFVASKNGEMISMEKLSYVALTKQSVKTILQVIIYWISEEEYRIDFALRQ